MTLRREEDEESWGTMENDLDRRFQKIDLTV